MNWPSCEQRCWRRRRHGRLVFLPLPWRGRSPLEVGLAWLNTFVFEDENQSHQPRRAGGRLAAYPMRSPIPSAIAVVVWGLFSINFLRKSWLATAASLTLCAPSTAASTVLS